MLSPLPLLGWIIDASLKGSVVIALVAVIVVVAGVRLGARWRHALWLIVLLRLALPVLPSSSWSIFNLVRLVPPFMLRSAEPVVVIPAGAALATLTGTVWFRPAHPGLWSRSGDLLVSVWLLGIALVVLRLIVASFRLQRRVAHAQRWPALEAGLYPLLEECRAKLGIRRTVRLVISDAVKTPALRGVIRPALLLPPDVVGRFSQGELRHIMLHELWHVRRLDVAVNWILSAIQALHWFNPLVWFAVARIREEREICCDELALSCLEEDERISYGSTMLRLLEQFRTAAPVPALVGIVNHKQQMKRRLMMIASFKKRPRYSLLYVVIVAFVGTVAFTDARGEQARVMKRMNPAACAMFGKLDQKVTADLTNASFGDVLNVVASKAGVVVTQSPDIASSRAQQAKFTIHATNVPAHMVLMEALAPFELMAQPDANGVTIQSGSACKMMARHAEHHESTLEEGTHVRREEVRVVVNGDKKELEDVDIDSIEPPAGPGQRMIKVVAHANGSGDCKLSADGKLHRDLTLKVDENGTVSEGRLQLDIDAPASK